MRKGGGKQAEEAHIVPACQHSSSYFIIYLRAEIGGWVRWKDRMSMCVHVEGNGGERGRKMMSCCSFSS